MDLSDRPHISGVFFNVFKIYTNSRKWIMFFLVDISYVVFVRKRRQSLRVVRGDKKGTQSQMRR
jgi:hypothetical protein